MLDKVRVGIIGSQFVSTIHVEALQTVRDAEIIAVASPTPGNADELAEKFSIPNSFTNVDELLSINDIDLSQYPTHVDITIVWIVTGVLEFLLLHKALSVVHQIEFVRQCTG